MYKKQMYTTNQFSTYYRLTDAFVATSKLKYNKYIQFLTNIYIYYIREAIIQD